MLGTLGDGETPPVDQAKPTGDEAHPHEEDSTLKGRTERIPWLKISLFFFLLPFSIFLIYM